MHDAVMASAADADIFIAVAAVADWRVKNVSTQKLKKTSEGGGAPLMEFEPNPDILAEVAKLENGPWCVGFAAETEKLAEHAEAKRARKGIPLLVGNLAHKVMDADTTELVLFDAQGAHPLPAGDKLDAARRLIAEIAARMPA
ncbi:Coenzyme A biosynthesis bifunctional protein CoaBC [compost metagenome]